jgi:acyl-CoA thioester hydrolase
MSDFAQVHVDVEVRFRDTDAMGHVNNAVYLSYLEVARQKYWREVMGLEDFRKVDLILVRSEIDYRSPVITGETVRVHLKITRLGNSSFDFAYRVEEAGSGRLVAEAKSVQAFFDYAKNKVKRISPEVRAKLNAFEGLAENAA